MESQEIAFIKSFSPRLSQMDARSSRDTCQLQVRESISRGSPEATRLQQALEGEISSSSTAEFINNEGAARTDSAPVFAQQMGCVRVRPGRNECVRESTLTSEDKTEPSVCETHAA